MCFLPFLYGALVLFRRKWYLATRIWVLNALITIQLVIIFRAFVDRTRSYDSLKRQNTSEVHTNPSTQIQNYSLYLLVDVLY